jgi:hypothetical protein
MGMRSLLLWAGGRNVNGQARRSTFTSARPMQTSSPIAAAIRRPDLSAGAGSDFDYNDRVMQLWLH